MNFDDIDKVYVISLPHSERREWVKLHLANHKIKFQWWDAFKNEDGAKGLRITMHYLFSDILLNGYENVLILEDDVEFLCSDPRKEISKVINDLPSDYDLCKFGANLLFPVSKITDNLNRIMMSYALHAVMYSLAGIRKILKMSTFEEPIDVIIAKLVEPDGHCFVSSKMLATQRAGKSNIFKFDPTIHSHNSVKEIYDPETEIVNWHNLMASQWDKNTKHLK